MQERHNSIANAPIHGYASLVLNEFTHMAKATHHRPFKLMSNRHPQTYIPQLMAQMAICFFTCIHIFYFYCYLFIYLFFFFFGGVGVGWGGGGASWKIVIHEIWSYRHIYYALKHETEQNLDRCPNLNRCPKKGHPLVCWCSGLFFAP